MHHCRLNKMLKNTINTFQLFKFLNNQTKFLKICRKFSGFNDKRSKGPVAILGIETSCDDTACGIVNEHGNILADTKHSQLQFHLKTGGINPSFAQEMHRMYIESVVDDALKESNLSMENIDAIAVTNRPGIHFSLIIGIRYAKHLARKYSKPLIPVHHMEAHALTARMENPELNFPFLCLLASGGHCQLALVKNVNEFYLLGESIDSAPGSCFDRVARALRLQVLPEYRDFNGGKAIEAVAYKAKNANRFGFNLPLTYQRNCQFSFDGLRGAGIYTIDGLRNRLKIPPDEMIPYYKDFCASFLKVVTKHLLQRTQRAIQYCERVGAFGFGANRLPRQFVFSGGVACNDFIYKAMREMVEHFGFQSFRCSKRLCTDNGVMIAWNGIERWRQNATAYQNLDLNSILPDSSAKLGIDHTELVAKKNLKCDFVKVPSMEMDIVSKDGS